jgi:hypothetical protein
LVFLVGSWGGVLEAAMGGVLEAAMGGFFKWEVVLITWSGRGEKE